MQTAETPKTTKQQPPRAKRRSCRGCKRQDLNRWPDLGIEEMDGTLATQQYIQQLIRKNKSDVATICQCPPKQDTAAWQLEHMRQFTLELNTLAVMLMEDGCSSRTCPIMKATNEWIFLCAAHESQTRECCAIDYILHNLDSASALLNSPKHFPSRVTVSASSIKLFQNIARRLYRMFAHPFYHHQTVFFKFEDNTKLCTRFVHFVLSFNIMAPSMMILPLDLSSARLASSLSTAANPTNTSDV